MTNARAEGQVMLCKHIFSVCFMVRSCMYKFVEQNSLFMKNIFCKKKVIERISVLSRLHF